MNNKELFTKVCFGLGNVISIGFLYSQSQEHSSLRPGCCSPVRAGELRQVTESPREEFLFALTVGSLLE